MPIQKLQFKPGINTDVTSYSNEGGYVDCDKVRFRLGYPEKMGGWEKYSRNQYEGSARSLHNWIGLDGSDFLGVGTHLKYYIEEGESFNDITPIRATTSAGDVTFTATDGSKTLVVSDTNHGAIQNDFVTFSGAVSLGGTVTAAVLNKEYQVTKVNNSGEYEVTLAVAANSSDTGNGGSSTVGKYQINVGLDSQIGGTGWGAGLYGGLTNTGATQTTVNEGATFSSSDTTLTVTSATGIVANDFILVGNEIMKVTAVSSNDLTVTRAQKGTTATTHADGSVVVLIVGNTNSADDYFGWGNAASGGITTTTQLRIWTEDNFGEDLIINARNSALYYWDKADGTSTPAVELSTLTGHGTATSVPQIAKQVLVSDQDRHVIAFGCDGLGANSSATQGNGTQDPLLIRFSDQENAVDWWPSDTNTAGDLILGAGSQFVQAIETKREILIWTDSALHSMRFIGPPFTFGLQQLASGITIVGPKAAIASEDFVFWMGVDNFYIYSGQTKQLDCTVKDKVFNDFNLSQSDKVFAGVNSEYSEVFWFYPSQTNSLDNGGTGENDKYVVYNFKDDLWYYGNMDRTAWIDRSTRTYPIAASSGYLYNHEFGYNADGSSMDSFIESAPMDIGDGDRFSLVTKVIPDMTFAGSAALSSPLATFTIKARNNPGQSFDSTASANAVRTQVSPVEEYTSQLDMRVRGRSFSIRIDSDALGTKWKLGSPRVDIRPDGRR